VVPHVDPLYGLVGCGPPVLLMLAVLVGFPWGGGYGGG